MQPEGSWPCSQESYAGTYPEPDKSNPCYPILFLIHPFLILFIRLCLDLPKGPFPLRVPTKILYPFLFSMRTIHPTNFIILDLIILMIFYKGYKFEVLLWAVFSTSLFILFDSDILLSIFLQIPSVYVLLLMSETKFHAHTKLKAKPQFYVFQFLRF
jgi:hypothetical protein